MHKFYWVKIQQEKDEERNIMYKEMCTTLPYSSMLKLLFFGASEAIVAVCKGTLV